MAERRVKSRDRREKKNSDEKEVHQEATTSAAKVLDKVEESSDQAIILLMQAHGRSEKQAKCALNLLKRLGYNEKERYEMLHDKHNNVHLLCHFGSLCPIFIIALGIVLLLAGVAYEVFLNFF